MASYSNGYSQPNNQNQKQKGPVISQCKYGCGTLVQWSYAHHEMTGQWRKEDAQTHELHECPNYPQKGQQPQQQQQQQPQVQQQVQPQVRSTYKTGIADSHKQQETKSDLDQTLDVLYEFGSETLEKIKDLQKDNLTFNNEFSNIIVACNSIEGLIKNLTQNINRAIETLGGELLKINTRLEKAGVSTTLDDPSKIEKTEIKKDSEVKDDMEGVIQE